MGTDNELAPGETGGATPTDFVTIVVRADYVPHVSRLIADLDEQRRPIQPPDRRPPAPEHPAADWPVEELRRFALGRSRTHQTVIAIMDYLADRPEEFHRVADLMTALRLPHEKVNGAMAGLTRIVKASHNYTALGLPVRRISERLPGGEFHVSYSMSEQQARRWKLVRAGRAGAAQA